MPAPSPGSIVNESSSNIVALLIPVTFLLAIAIAVWQ
jgi:hypothetical protein